MSVPQALQRNNPVYTWGDLAKMKSALLLFVVATSLHAQSPPACQAGLDQVKGGDYVSAQDSLWACCDKWWASLVRFGWGSGFALAQALPRPLSMWVIAFLRELSPARFRRATVLLQARM